MGRTKQTAQHSTGGKMPRKIMRPTPVPVRNFPIQTQLLPVEELRVGEFLHGLTRDVWCIILAMCVDERLTVFLNKRDREAALAGVQQLTRIACVSRSMFVLTRCVQLQPLWRILFAALACVPLDRVPPAFPNQNCFTDPRVTSFRDASMVRIDVCVNQEKEAYQCGLTIEGPSPPFPDAVCGGMCWLGGAFGNVSVIGAFSRRDNDVLLPEEGIRPLPLIRTMSEYAKLSELVWLQAEIDSHLPFHPDAGERLEPTVFFYVFDFVARQWERLGLVYRSYHCDETQCVVDERRMCELSRILGLSAPIVDLPNCFDPARFAEGDLLPNSTRAMIDTSCACAGSFCKSQIREYHIVSGPMDEADP